MSDFNTPAQKQRLARAHYGIADKCLHCMYAKVHDRGGYEEWVRHPEDVNTIYCQHHCAWVGIYNICDDYTMGFSKRR